LFYAAAARHSLPDFFADVDEIILTILQPQSIEPEAEIVSSVVVTHAELDEFTTLFCKACEEALSPAPRLERGDHCRFCPAQPLCPAHTGPFLDFARFEVPTPSTHNYLELLARGLDLVNDVKDLSKTLHDQAKVALENGDLVRGYALSAGRAVRQWRDDEYTTIAALQDLGLTRSDVVAEELRSVKQIETRAHARGLKLPRDLIVSRRSGVSLVRVENARAPSESRGELVRSLSQALEAFQEGRKVN